MPESIRNVAIIAHVDHGKTTLVDHMLRQAGAFRSGAELIDRAMDTLDLERERGITILAKTTGIDWQGTRIHVVDTPGHADFGGEVERVLAMVDGALLLVDASEGPLPQTRFVLSKALAAHLAIVVCINKIDRPDARVDEVRDEIYDLFIDLGATDEQIDFPIVYACAREGYAGFEQDVTGGDLRPLFDAILSTVPPPDGAPDAPVRMLVTQLDRDDYVGRLAIGRVFDGTIRRHDTLACVGRDGVRRRVRVVQMFRFEGLRRVPAEEAHAGEIIALAGVDEVDIGDSLVDPERGRPLPRVRVEEPTIGVTFAANTGPLKGREGKYLTARQIRERLEWECQHNVALRIDPDGPAEEVRLLARGELQVTVLLEQMRREGFEMCVSRPRVRTREEGGRTLEPYEIAVVDVPEGYLGVVSEKMSLRRGRMVNLRAAGSGRVRVEYRVPSRGLVGFRGEFLNDTRGQGTLHRLFEGWDEWAGPIVSRVNGSLVADRLGRATAYALYHLQARGRLFVGPGEEVYEGMIVGENSRENDMNVNVCRAKQLTNLRAAGADEKLVLAPPVPLTLERALEFIADDELVEVTPGAIRLRKRVLEANRRSVVRRPGRKER